METRLRDREDYLEALATRTFDHLDVGCSHGGSMQFARRKLGSVAGVGIDVSADKLGSARDAGWDVFEFDLLAEKLPRNSVSFCTSFHVLEHLPSVAAAQLMVHRMVEVARGFVVMRHPYFDLDGYFAGRGVKFYHSDWSGHTNPLTSLDHYRIARSLPPARVRIYEVYGRNPFDPRSGEHLVPLDAPLNTTRPQAEKLVVPRPDLPEITAYKEIFVFIDLRERNDPEAWKDRILRRCRIRHEDLLFSYGRGADPIPHP